jgi:hypothetical protein
LLTLPSLLTIAALITAAAAMVRARRLAKRLERLTESYWELRYEIAQVRARVARLEPPAPAESPQAESSAAPGSTTFVSLSSLKRSS